MKIYELDDGPSAKEDLRSAAEMLITAEQLDEPEKLPITRERIVQLHATRNAGTLRISTWVGRRTDRVIAYARLVMPMDENASVVVLWPTVHPEWRRRGIGSAFLRELLPAIEAAGRTRLMASVRADGPGLSWAEKAGFKPTQGFIQQAVIFAEVDPQLWDVPVAEGYELREWVGAAPKELLASFAAARQAIHDAPHGEIGFKEPDWTPERVRKEEAGLVAEGVEQRLVVAVRQSDQMIVGITETNFTKSLPDRALQCDTAVLEEHRGLGLGRAMKAAMLRKLRSERPKVTRISTQTAVDNVHMARVSRQVGYRDLSVTQWVEADLEDVRRALGRPSPM